MAWLRAQWPVGRNSRIPLGACTIGILNALKSHAGYRSPTRPASTPAGNLERFTQLCRRKMKQYGSGLSVLLWIGEQRHLGGSHHGERAV
jgi:hypothetical protein